MNVFENAIKTGIVAVNFTLIDKCKFVQLLEPKLQELSNKYASKVKFYKIDVDKEVALTQKYNIRVVPTVIFFKNGSLMTIVEGIDTRMIDQKLDFLIQETDKKI